MAKKKLKFALFGNVYQTKKSASVHQIISLLTQKGAELCIERDFYNFLISKQKLSINDVEIFDGSNFSADFVISVGGDGTFLRAAAFVGDKEIPILGINTGHLGFLSDVGADGIEGEIDMIYNGNYDIESRTVVQVLADGKPLSQHPCALNDIAILKRDNASMISICTHINNEYLTTFQADGLIISTPTGSTAYSLSVGGPIVEPNNNTLTLTAVAPHSLNIRPIVINDESVVSISVESRNDTFLVGIDGRSEKCSEETKITISKAPYKIKIVRQKGKQFFATLREKLLLGVQNAINN